MRKPEELFYWEVAGISGASDSIHSAKADASRELRSIYESYLANRWDVSGSKAREWAGYMAKIRTPANEVLIGKIAGKRANRRASVRWQ